MVVISHLLFCQHITGPFCAQNDVNFGDWRQLVLIVVSRIVKKVPNLEEAQPAFRLSQFRLYWSQIL